MLEEIFNSKKTLKLLGHEKNFDFFKNLLSIKKFPNVIMLAGEKGIGKSTFVNHLMYYYFDKENYDLFKKTLLIKSPFYQQFIDNIFSNIIYLNGTDFKNAKVEEIRKLKNKLLKTPILKDKRFIILDDVESFNNNSLNALLKVMEEPSNNYFLLINNKTAPILDTIKSRCMIINFSLNTESRIKIKSLLIDYYKQKLIFEKELISVSPGQFLKFNFFFNDKKMNIEDNYISNIKIILNFYKKDKNVFYKFLIIFYTEYYLTKNNKVILNDIKLIENRSSVIKNINDYFLYNLNQSSLIRSLERSFK